MPEAIIQVQNLSKKYYLGTINAGTLKEDIGHWWKTSVLKKENAVIESSEFLQDKSNAFWALRDINFDVKKGEVLGVIGKNGAGKSTLLKILSHVTQPTTGSIKGKGRVASLLEVGTGFHDELTGRENIFLNGNILGMRNQEIRKKFDQIVDFSGIGKFIDTPVKRYSSGMYVRLAFAIAAHLDPEILVVDEVLAVGDAEFQKRCLGKMHDLSGSHGSTVIFVSHNMQAVQNLCSRAILLQDGEITKEGLPTQVINHYVQLTKKYKFTEAWNDTSAPGNEFIKVRRVELVPELLPEQEVIDIRTPLQVNFTFENHLPDESNLCTGVHLFTATGDCIFDVSSDPQNYHPGIFNGSCTIPGHFLNDGAYYISIIFVKDTSIQLFYLEECLAFEVEDYRENFSWYGKWIGHVRPNFPVIIHPLEKY